MSIKCTSARMSFVPPIIDCSPCSVGNLDFEPNSAESRKLAAELHKAFTEVGFAYIINHGVSEQEVAELWKISEDFFKLPIKEKAKVERSKNGGAIGWQPLATEVVSGEKGDGADQKECYNFFPHDHDFEALSITKHFQWPNDDVLPNFMKIHNDLFKTMTQLFKNFLKVLPYGLNLKDKNAFTDLHQKIGKPGSFCSLRVLTYPPMKEDVTEGTRCGVHSDYGTLSFTMQDTGGLELLTKEGEWVKPDPVHGAFLVFPADSLGFQTSDQYWGVKHRVSLPEKSDKSRYKTRRSFVFFGAPDNEASIAPLDGSNMFPKRSFNDYSFEKIKATY